MIDQIGHTTRDVSKYGVYIHGFTPGGSGRGKFAYAKGRYLLVQSNSVYVARVAHSSHASGMRTVRESRSLFSSSVDQCRFA